MKATGKQIATIERNKSRVHVDKIVSRYHRDGRETDWVVVEAMLDKPEKFTRRISTLIGYMFESNNTELRSFNERVARAQADTRKK